MIKKPDNVKKILAIRNDKIGDLVLSSNVIELLSKEFPQATIDIIVSKENKELIENNPHVSKIRVLNYSPRTLKQFLEYYRMSREIKREKYDLGVEIRGGLFNTFFLLFLGGVKFKIGFYTNELTKLMLDSAYLKDYKGHATQNMVKMVNHGLKTNYPYIPPKIYTNKGDMKSIARFLKKKKLRRFICLCIDASNEDKQWALEKFDALIKKFQIKYPEHKVVLVGVDTKKMDFLIERNPKCIIALKENLRLLYLLFGRSDLVMGPDGGTMHLAWVSKTNTITLIPDYLASYLEDIKPLGKNSRFILKKLDKIQIEDVTSLIDKILLK